MQLSNSGKSRPTVFANFVDSDEIIYVDDQKNALVVTKLGDHVRECPLPNAQEVTCLKPCENFKRYFLIGYSDGLVEVYCS